MAQTVKTGIIPWTKAHTDSCVALTMKNAESTQWAYRQILGEELHDAAFPGWRETAEAAIRSQEAEDNGFVLMDGDTVEAFGAYRFNGRVAGISLCEGTSREYLEALLKFLLEDMKKKGVTYCTINCDTEPECVDLRAALEAVGFEKNLPHVKYFQTLKPRPELPETQLQVVPACEEYVEDCVRIALKLWTIIHRAYADLIGDDIHDVTAAGWQDALRVNISNQQRRPTSLVALLDGKVVGFCGCRVENGTLGVIGYNGVDPEYRGRGIARYMYEAAFDSFRAQGIRHARVFTGGDDGHGPARRAYEKAGYDKKILNVTYYKIL